MPSTSATVVLGAATRLAPRSFEPFAASLRATGYRGRLGIVIGQYNQPDTREIQELADFSTVVDGSYGRVSGLLVGGLRATRDTRGVRRAYRPLFRGLSSVPPRARRRRAALEFRVEGLQSLRYGHYLDLLENHAHDADQVLITDMRDVIFQADPFSAPIDGLEVFLEDPSYTIAGTAFNRQWMRDLYGPTVVAALADHVVSCSGTVAGPRDDMIRYLRCMVNAVRDQAPLGSRDQAIHNRLLRGGELDPVTVIANGTGRVLTMGGVARVRRDDTGRVLNDDGTVAPVLHQYDRHPWLAADLLQRVNPHHGK